MSTILVNTKVSRGLLAKKDDATIHFQKFGISLRGYAKDTPDGHGCSYIKLLLVGDEPSIEAAISETDCEITSSEELKSFRQIYR